MIVFECERDRLLGTDVGAAAAAEALGPVQVGDFAADEVLGAPGFGGPGRGGRPPRRGGVGGGCGCASSGGPPAGLLGLILLGILRLRRRR